MAHHQWAHFLGKAGRSLGHCCLTPIKAPLSQPDVTRQHGGSGLKPPVAVELATSLSPGLPLLSFGLEKFQEYLWTIPDPETQEKAISPLPRTY